MFDYEIIGVLFGAFFVSLIVIFAIKVYYSLDEKRISDKRRQRLDALREELQREFYEYADFITMGVAFEIIKMSESKAVAETTTAYLKFREKKIKLRDDSNVGIRRYWSNRDAPDAMDREGKRLEGVMHHAQSRSLSDILPMMPSALAQYLGQIEIDELRYKVFAAIERSRWSD